jgi:predicted GH43/DUF377 family glycosyl hydrolase
MSLSTKPVSAKGMLSIPETILWCGTMVRTPDGRCHLMVSLWPEKLGFESWLYHSEIGYAVADHPGAAYEFKGTVFRGAADPDAWDRDMVHNPWIIQHERKFYMYYTGNCGDGTFPSHRYNQRVGLAVADDPAGPWSRLGQPLAPATPGSWNELVSCNPSVCRMPDGRFIMLYRTCSNPDNPRFHGDIMLGVAFADKPEGPFIRHPKPIFRKEDEAFAAEDPGVFRWGDKLYAVFKDMGTHFNPAVKRSLILAESDDGIDWRIIKPLLNRQLDFGESGKQIVFRMERPFVYTEDNSPKQIFVAVKPENDEDHAFNVHLDIEIQPE